MNTAAAVSSMDPVVKARMQEACDRISQGVVPTMEQRQAAAVQIDQMRVENATRFDIQNATLEAVRESRRSQ